MQKDEQAKGHKEQERYNKSQDEEAIENKHAHQDFIILVACAVYYVVENSSKDTHPWIPCFV